MVVHLGVILVAVASVVATACVIQRDVTLDVHLSWLAGPVVAGPVQLRVLVEPRVIWLWIAGGLIAVETGLTAFPGRRHRPTEPRSAPVPELQRARAGAI